MKKRATALFLACLFLVCLFTGVPTAAAEEDDAIRVCTARELLEAIAPGAVIALEPGTYDLSATIAAMEDRAGWVREHPWVEFEDSYDGYGVIIRDLEGLMLIGLGEGSGDARIVTEPRYTDVLRFRNCKLLRLANLTFGHTPEQGSCVGDVLEFQSCSDIGLTSVDLYGCGTYGICADRTTNLVMESSTIHDCSYGLLALNDCSDFRFVNSTLRDCEGYDMLDVRSSSLSFDGCTFEGNSGMWSFVPENCGSSIRFNACSFGLWESYEIRHRTDDGALSFDDSCSYEDPDPEAGEGGPVEIGSVGALFEAIRPGATICVLPGRYNITEWLESVRGDADAWNAEHPYVRIEQCYDGLQTVICNVDGLHIMGMGLDRAGTEFVIEPRYADVFAFHNCSNISFSNLTAGHTDTGECAGAVLSFESADDVILTNLDLYGCGVYGVEAWRSGNLSMRGCTVRDCSYGPVSIYSSYGTYSFEDSVFDGSDGGFVFYDSGTAYFMRCIFGELEGQGLAAQANVAWDNCLWLEPFRSTSG